MPTPPIHPRLAPASLPATKSNPLESITLAHPGERWRLRVDFGAAYAALLGRKIRGRAPTMMIEIVLRVEARAVHGDTTNGGGVVLRGPTRWRTNAAPGGFAVPSELRCPFAPTPKFPQSIMIGSEGDVGGMMDGSWIIGQFGTVVSAERVEVDA